MVVHTKDYKMSYLVETNYAGGDAGLEFACTPLDAGDVANVTAFHIPSGSISYPYREYEKEKVKSAGMAVGTNAEFIKGYSYKDCSLPMFQWTDVFLDAAIDVDGTYASYLIHVEDGTDHFDACGAMVKKWELSAKGDEFPTETVDFIYYDVVDSVAVTTHPAFTTTQPGVFKDITVSIGGHLIGDLTEITATIEKEYQDVMVAGKYPRAKTEVVAITSKIELKFMSDTADNLIYDPREAIDTHAVIITRLAALKDLTISSMSVTESNVNEVPEFGLWEHSITLENSGACVYSIA